MVIQSSVRNHSTVPKEVVMEPVTIAGRRGSGWRMVLMALAAAVSVTVVKSAEAQEPNEPPARRYGAYVGTVIEETKLASTPVTSNYSSTVRIGLVLGPWSVGYVEKSLSSGIWYLPRGMTLRGLEVGRMLDHWWIVQPSAQLTMGTAAVSSERSKVPVIEPSVVLGTSIWPTRPIFRIEGRVGLRISGRAKFDDLTNDVSTSGLFASYTMTIGWHGDWSSLSR
jgi:hypothetical protein